MKLFTRIIALMLSLALIFSMTACGPKEDSNKDNSNISKEESDAQGGEESKEEQKDDKKEDAKKPVILAVSFGTSYNDTREKTIGAIETALQKAYPDYEVRRAFTSQTIIDILKDRDKLEIDNVTDAMKKLVQDGVKEVVVQPTHVIPGIEYDDIIKEIESYSKMFDSFKVGKPLLTEDKDFDNLVIHLTKETDQYTDEKTAIVFMGHGTHHKANETYAKLQKKLHEKGFINYFIGTVEATPSLDDVLASVKVTTATRVILLPLMIVAGDHASNDMAGDEEDSWKTAFKNAGFDVECVLKGLGEYKGVQVMILEHAKDAMNALDPIKASQIKEGSYEISVKSSSSMFKVVKCVLKVENNSMNATMTMSGTGYGKLFAGTGEEAAKATEDKFILANKDAEDVVSFVFPIEELNSEVDCAAWSIKKEKWYDRVLVFESTNIPEDAINLEK